MSEIITVSSDNTEPFNLSYVGDVEYKSEEYPSYSGYSFTLADSLDDPIYYTNARNSAYILTKNRFNSDIYKDIRDIKSGILDVTYDALALNDYSEVELLSATAIDDNSNTDIIAIGEGDEDAPDLTTYSLNTPINFSNIFWKYNNGALDVSIEFDESDPDFYFYIQFKTRTECNIIKGVDGGIEYLTYNTGSGLFTFESTEDDTYSVFAYSYNSVNKTIMLILNEVGIFVINADTEVIELTPFPLTEPLDQTNIFTVGNKNALEESEPILESFVPYYDESNKISNVYPVDNMGMVTHNFASADEKNSNFINLKSNVTYDGEYSLLNIDKNLYSRDYSSINTGMRGDSGYTNIVMNYNSGHYKYNFVPDKQSYFNVPYKLRGYEQININDCTLIDNGAIGGNSPANSDRIYMKSYIGQDIRKVGISPHADGSVYLCTWLFFNPLRPASSVWLDRYYNPDVVTKLDALSIEAWNNKLKDLESFSTTHNFLGVYGDYYDSFNRDIGIFDVLSKVTIRENGAYIYDRIGKDKATDLIADNEGKVLVETSNVEMDFETTEVLLTDTSENDSEFTIGIDLGDFNTNTFVGNTIFTNTNISMVVDKNYSPYCYAINGTNVDTYDYDYNIIRTVDIGTTVKTIIPTDNFKKLFVEDVNKVLYAINEDGFISSVSTELSGITAQHFTYDRSTDSLFVIDSLFDIYQYFLETDTLQLYSSSASGDNLIKTFEGEVIGKQGDYIDYDDLGNIYVLDGNSIFYNDLATPIISTNETMVDMVVTSSSTIYALKDNGDNTADLIKVDTSFIAKVVGSTTIELDGNVELLGQGRYLRNGIVTEYIDVLDKDGSTNVIYRYDMELNLLDTITKTLTGGLVKDSSIYYTKFYERGLSVEFQLFSVFDASVYNTITFDIDDKLINQDKDCYLSCVFSNKYGMIGIYCNGSLVNLYQFDNDTYRFSNTLRDNKIFVGVPSFDAERSLDDVVIGGNNDMICGNFTLDRLVFYDTLFNVYDVWNYIRTKRDAGTCSLIIPIQNRSYIEEIAGFYNQNKNIRKSEYGNIVIRGTELTEEQAADVTDKINTVFDETFINLRINESTFE